MANLKISDATAASALTGAESVGGVQGGANVEITLDRIKEYCRDYGEAALAFIAGGPNLFCIGGRRIVRASAGNWYAFFTDGTFAYHYYQKSSDYGRTWGKPIAINETSTRLYAQWFDKWTPGDSGTKIHMAYMELGGSDVIYRSLDTATDTLSTPVTVYNGTSLVTGEDTCISITKAVGGLIHVAFDIDGGTEVGHYVSDASTPTSFSSADGSGALVEGAASSDYFQLYPANLADTADIWCMYLDRSAGQFTLKTFDASASSWSESAAMATGVINEAGNGGGSQFAGTVRLSDGHLFVLLFTDYDSATGDLLCWDINGAASITARTDVITNTDDVGYCAICADVTSGTTTLYAFYCGKATGAETFDTLVTVNYKTSTDSGATWSAEQEFASQLHERKSLSSTLQTTDGELVLDSIGAGLAVNLLMVFPLT